jgi:hypothetical protein
MFAPALMAGAAALQAIGSITAGGDAARSMNTQADAMLMGATNARQVGSARGDRVNYENQLKLGEQRAAAAQSGFDPNTGTTLKMQGESAGNAELDALYQRYEGELRAIDLTNQSSMLKANAKSARRQGYLNAGAQLLSGGARAYATATTINRDPGVF